MSTMTIHTLRLQCILCGESVFQTLQLKKSNCNGNFNGRSNTCKEKKHLRTDNSDICLNLRAIAESCSGFLFCGQVVYCK